MFGNRCFLMTKDERWLANWKQEIDNIVTNHRQPSKLIDKERGLRNWWKYQQKLLNAGRMKCEWVEKFRDLLALGEKYKRVNQYV